PAPLHSPPLHDALPISPRFVVARDRENAVTSVSIAYQFPHRPDASAADYRRSLVEAMFAQLLSERLDLIAKRGSSSWTDASVSRSEEHTSELQSPDHIV